MTNLLWAKSINVSQRLSLLIILIVNCYFQSSRDPDRLGKLRKDISPWHWKNWNSNILFLFCECSEQSFKISVFYFSHWKNSH